MKRIIILTLIIATLTPYVSQAEDEEKYVACEGKVISYKSKASHIKNENSIAHWFDVIEIELSYPDKWKGRHITVGCDSPLVGFHALRQVGKIIKFKADRFYINDKSLKKEKADKLLFVGIGALGFGNAKVKTQSRSKSEPLVIYGTVLIIQQLPTGLSSLFKEWGVTFRVDKVISGEYVGKEFSVRLHSPARQGLEKGRSYRVELTGDGSGIKQVRLLE